MYLPTPSIPEIVEQLGRLTHTPNTLAVLFVGEKTPLDIPQLITALNQQNIPFMGGIFPGVIEGTKRYETGIVVSAMPCLAKPTVIPNLNDDSFSVDMLAPLTRAVAESPIRPTALVLVDGLTRNITSLLARTFSHLQQNRVTYIGGGAGSLSLQPQPCVFTNAGFFQDAAVVALVNQQTEIGVRHGWRSLKGPIIATKTRRNVILELDYQPAFDVYSQFIEKQTGQTLTKDNFFDIAKGYPLGLFRNGADRVVRDPITFTEDGELVCVGEVREPSSLYFLNGDSRRLIEHAKRATREALKNQTTVDQCLVIDCISRVLFLGDRFQEELEAVCETLPPGSAAPVGALTLGEIGSYASGAVEFFNKTIVVGIM